MFQQTSPSNEPVVGISSVLCGLAHLSELTLSNLYNSGLCIDALAPTKLVLDIPFGYVLSALEQEKNDSLQLLVVTWNQCQEYLEDLWDLQPGALLAGDVFQKHSLVEMLSNAITQVSYGKRYRLTPGPSTPLTSRERAVLHYVARGWSNKCVAQRLHIEVQTVKNVLRSVYRKLGISSHAQAALYYWGVLSHSSQSLEATDHISPLFGIG
jgi:DNA-binding CsgD family transcriptional regulator